MDLSLESDIPIVYTMRWIGTATFRSVKEVVKATAFPVDRADSKRRFLLIYLTRLFFFVGVRLWKDNCPRQAAALSYQTVLSMVPLLAVALATTTWLNLGEFKEHLTAFAATHLMPSSAQSVGAFIIESASSVRLQAMGVVGGFSVLVLSVLLLFTIESAINEIFRCTRKRPLWARLLTVLLLLILGPPALVLSLYFTGRLVFFRHLVSGLMPLVFTVIPIFFAYWLVPRTPIRLRNALVASIITGILLEGLKIGFAFYVTHLGQTLSYLYGAVAILPLAMVWIYLTWLIFLFGAELNAALHEVKRRDQFLGGAF